MVQRPQDCGNSTASSRPPVFIPESPANWTWLSRRALHDSLFRDPVCFTDVCPHSKTLVAIFAMPVPPC